MNNIIEGKKGEILAQKFLKKKGFKILQTNYRNKIGEIDIICFDNKNNEIIFIEVKTRSTLQMGMPCEAVDFRKQKKIRNTASLYLLQNNKLDDKIRFDVIEVLNGEINHIEYAF